MMDDNSPQSEPSPIRRNADLIVAAAAVLITIVAWSSGPRDEGDSKGGVPWHRQAAQFAEGAAAQADRSGDQTAQNRNARGRQNQAAQNERKKTRNLLTNEEAQRAGPGNWRRVRQGRGTAQLSPEQLAEIKRLESLGYLTGSRSSDLSGVLRHDEDASQDGWTLYTSGHDASAMLIDIKGQVRHRWEYSWEKAFPNDTRRSFEGMEWWCWVHPFETGELLAVFSGAGIIKIDARSRLLWALPNNAHHDVDVAPDGTIYVLTRISHIIPHINEEEPILEDFITVLDPEGNEIKSFSLVDAFENSEHASAWRYKRAKPKGDAMHTNAVVLLDGTGSDRVPEFRRGNLLVSIRQTSLLAVVDPETEKVVWAQKGPFRLQHDPHILENGNLLLFDNSGTGEQDSSRALEIDPTTMQIVWDLTGNSGQPMWSQFMGAVQRLENGNTLVTESEGGRILEVTPERRIVWEYYTPHRSGEGDEFIASICRARRMPADFGSRFQG